MPFMPFSTDIGLDLYRFLATCKKLHGNTKSYMENYQSTPFLQSAQ